MARKMKAAKALPVKRRLATALRNLLARCQNSREFTVYPDAQDKRAIREGYAALNAYDGVR